MTYIVKWARVGEEQELECIKLSPRLLTRRLRNACRNNPSGIIIYSVEIEMPKKNKYNPSKMPVMTHKVKKGAFLKTMTNRVKRLNRFRHRK